MSTLQGEPADQNVREIRATDETAFSSYDGHTLQKGEAGWVPRRGEACASTGIDVRGMGAPSYFGRCRGWRSDRRFSPDCWPLTGSVPLHSGYLLQDQNGPVLPVRWWVVLPHKGQVGPSGRLMDNAVPRYCCTS